MTLSDYVLSQLVLLTAGDLPDQDDRPTMREIVARVRGGELYDLGGKPTEIIRRWRDAG